jgi:hypothetical protein
LSIHKDAEDDLDALWEADPEGAAMIDVFLEEVASASQDVLERLTSDGYRSYTNDPDFDIKRWKALWKNYPLWRLRLFNVPGVAASHRIVYTFHPQELRYYVLGIVPRDFNYDPGHPLSKRIIAACGNLGLS